MNKWQVLNKSTLNWLAIGERRGLKINFGAKCHSQQPLGAVSRCCWKYKIEQKRIGYNLLIKDC